MIVANSFEDLQKKLKIEYERIIEESDMFWVKVHDGWIKVYKPRRKEEIENILTEGRFPKKYIQQVLKGKRIKTEALEKALRTKKKWIIQEGMAGVGKTYALIYKISLLVKFYHLHRPLYIPLQSFSISEYKTLCLEADGYLMDDLNTNLNEYKRDFVIELIYHAYNENKLLYITTNSKIRPDATKEDTSSLLTFLREEPVISRLLEMCEFHIIKEKRDLRLVRR